MDRRTVALGIAAAVAVGVAVAVTLLGRSSASPKHKAVASYITDVDQIQQGMQVELINTVSVFRAFANGAIPAKTLVPRLGQAERTLRRLQGRLVALPAPVPAKRLRKLLIRLVGSEVSTAHEVGQLATFSPKFAVLLKAVRTAGSELATALRDLSPRRRLILFLRYYADCSHAEIASICGISEGTVSATLAKAKEALRVSLRKEALA